MPRYECAAHHFPPVGVSFARQTWEAGTAPRSLLPASLLRQLGRAARAGRRGPRGWSSSPQQQTCRLADLVPLEWPAGTERSLSALRGGPLVTAAPLSWRPASLVRN